MTPGADAPRDPRPVMSVRGLGRAHRQGAGVVHALHAVDFTVEAGSFWSVMGPSGSGKSTLLGILGCLDRASAGRYLLDGHDVTGLDDDAMSAIRLARIGFVFQSFHLIAQLSVSENIELPLFYQGRPPDESAERAVALARSVGIEDRLAHSPQTLSGGERQRVAIARALANEPAVILADEPTGNLDSATGHQVMALFAALNAQGRTIVMVTHEEEIAAYSSHRLHLRDGRVESVG